jgi:flagellar biosynthesis/type III secretory pathway M-ring protein FliF/YscJ
MVKKMNATLNNTPDWKKALIGITLMAVMIFFSLLLVSCKTQQPTIVEKVVTNIEYIDRYHYDSIYNDRIVYVDRGSDTIKMIERAIEYRYKVLTDSIEVLKVDSIPYEVEHIVEVNKMNNHQRTMYWLGWIAVLIVGLRLFWKIYKKIK